MENVENKTVSFGDFELDEDRRLLVKRGEPVNLNPKTFDLLLVLLSNHGKLLTKNELLDTVWKGSFVEENNLTVHIAALRKILGEKRNEHQFIVTVPNKGYKFVAELNGHQNGEIIVERHSVERIIIEEEIISDSPNALELPPVSPFNALQNFYKKSFKLPIYTILGIGLVSVVLGFWYLNFKKNTERKPLRFTKLTSSGKVTNATLTPDSKYAVYSQVEKDGESLWLKQIATGSQNQILKPQPVNFVGLTVSPDGNFIYATVFSGNFPDPQLWRIPLLGGAIEQIQGITTGATVSLAPDGQHFAFVESHSSIKETHFGIADSNGANKKILVRAKDEQRSFPNFKASPVAWSPNGNEIACVVEQKTADGGTKAGILLINSSDASERFITEKRWDYIENVTWIDAGNLALTATSMNQGQVWKVSRTTREAQQITNDLNNYAWLASGSDGNLLTVQKEVVSKVSVTDFDETAKNLPNRQIFEESGLISNVNWTADGKILYSSTASGQPEIWQINSDGTEKTQLTVNSGIYFGLSVSPIDGSLLFCSTQNGKHSLHLTDSEGKNRRELIDGTEDVWANFTPDGQSVIFQRGLNNKLITLWRLDLKDKKLTQLTQNHSLHPAISPDGSQTAYYFMDADADNLWRIKLISSTTGDTLAKINLPPIATKRMMRWSPNGKFISQIANQGEEIKLLLIPISRNNSIEIFDLGKGNLDWFEWSKDGKKIVVSQSTETQDIVLLSQ